MRSWPAQRTWPNPPTQLTRAPWGPRVGETTLEKQGASLTSWVVETFGRTDGGYPASMVFAFRYVPPEGEPQPVGTGEGSGDTAVVDAFKDLRDRSADVGLPAGEYQYKAMEQGEIPGIMPGLATGPEFWAPLILDPDGTINV
jgi:hypothetical protein